ncbi:MAG: XdhC/CoxI family protein [Chloroflexi bacterium]|nr:XdhC/CoxI family protein [Chloroflexota bacterium]
MANATEIARALLTAAREGPAVASCTVMGATDGVDISLGAKMLVYADSELGDIGGGALEQAVIDFARASIPKHIVQTTAFTPSGDLVEGRRAIESADAIVEILVEIVEPAATLLVVGGGHVGLAVGQLGAMLGMEVAIIDDRQDYANEDRFPYEAKVICGDFGEELEQFPITANTFIVLVSRGHKVDELALRTVAERGAGYVGMIGSKRRTRTVLQHLAEEGLDPEALDKVFTPIGLDIGAETPEEIAVSVLGEIILVRRGGGAQPMSEYGRLLASPRR